MIKNTLRLLAAGMIVSACQTSEVEKVMEGHLGFELSHIDSSYSPCEDFFMFANAGWMQENPIPPTEARWGSFPILVEENNNKLRDLLEGMPAGDALQNGDWKQQLRDFYISAMDSILVEDLGITPLNSIFETINAITGKAELANYLQTAVKEQLAKPFGMYVSTDSKNSEAYALYISQSGLGLPDRDYYFKDDEASLEIQAAYIQLLTDVFTMLGKEDQAAKFAKETYDLEKAIAGFHMSRVDQRKPEFTYNKMTISELSALMPIFAWEESFKDLGVSVDSVIVRQPKYLTGLETLLNNVSIDVWRNYFTWQTINQYSDYLPSEWVQRHFDFYGVYLSGTKEMKPRWKRSIDKLNGGFSETLGRLFAETYFSPESRSRVEKMVEDIRSVYRERIEENAWMSDRTKELAIEKLNAFKYKIGYPDNWTDFSAIEIAPNDLLGNRRRINAWQFAERLGRLGKPVDKTEWFMGAHIVNAYYSPSFNEIVFPAGILQPPFFDPTADDAVNYGGIGGVIGHEFTHGFDDQGRKYNAFGNLTGWWTEEDSLRFSERAQRVIDFYGRLEPIDGYFVDGELTQGENIADIGGLTLAFHAYQKHIERTGARTIDGFTPEQRLFMGWAKVWQSHATDAYLRKQVLTDPHSPAQYRVNATVSMLPEFAEAFGCTPQDPLVITEEERALIW
jgi:putative endopeptidase